MDKLRDIVCRNFNDLVDKSPMTKREIARLLKVSEATMQRWGTSKEKGGNPPTLDNIEALAEILKIDPLEFYKTDMAPAPLTMPVSKTLLKMMAIPDRIYDVARDIGKDDPIWDIVYDTLETVNERVKKGEKLSGLD